MMPQVGIKEFIAFESNTFVQASAQMGQNTIRKEITHLSCRPSLTYVIPGGRFVFPCLMSRWCNMLESKNSLRTYDSAGRMEILRIVIILR